MGNNLICKHCGETVTQPKHTCGGSPYHTMCYIEFLEDEVGRLQNKLWKYGQAILDEEQE